MRIGLVHNHNQGTSATFLADLLRLHADVVEFAAPPPTDHKGIDVLVRSIMSCNFDRLVLFQVDEIAQRLTQLDLGRTFVVPSLADLLPGNDWKWRSLVPYQLLCFSRLHHDRAQRAGCRSACFQYIPDVDLSSVEQVNALDDGAGAVDVDVDRALAARQADLLGLPVHLLAAEDKHPPEALFYFAASSHASIDGAFLQAMARGQVVVAPASPLVSDHVAHMTTGLIYDPHLPPTQNSFPRLADSDWRAIGRAARRRIEVGRRTWLMDADRLLSLVLVDGKRWPSGDFSSHFATTIRRAAYERFR